MVKMMTHESSIVNDLNSMSVSENTDWGIGGGNGSYTKSYEDSEEKQ